MKGFIKFKLNLNWLNAHKTANFNARINACVNPTLYWLNYWHTSCKKGTSCFTFNTLLIRIQ